VLRIILKDKENIDKALKRFKRKFIQTQVSKQLRERMHFIKKSAKKRKQKIKAEYNERRKNKENDI
jgi:small subunit ribosomal protein S21